MSGLLRQLPGEPVDSAASRPLQAAMAPCHARARTAEETDWRRIAAIYASLAELAPSLRSWS